MKNPFHPRYPRLVLLFLFDQVPAQNSDAGQIAIAFVVVESVTDYEFVFNFKPEIVGIDFALALFLFTQEHTDFDAARSCGFKFLADGRQRVSAVEDVVENKDMSILHVRQRDLFKDHLAAGLRFSVITGDAEAIQLQRKRNPPEQIGHEHQAAVQDRDHSQFFSGVIFRNLGGDFVQPPKNRRLIEQHALKVVLH